MRIHFSGVQQYVASEFVQFSARATGALVFYLLTDVIVQLLPFNDQFIGYFVLCMIGFCVALVIGLRLQRLHSLPYWPYILAYVAISTGLFAFNLGTSDDAYFLAPFFLGCSLSGVFFARITPL